MQIQLIDTKILLVAFLLVCLAVLMMTGGHVWDLIGAENNYPVNDCGKNYFFVFEWTDPNGCTQRHTRAGADRDYVDAIRRTFDPDQIGGTLNQALQHVEQWIIK